MGMVVQADGVYGRFFLYLFRITGIVSGMKASAPPVTNSPADGRETENNL
jgi:hypothetical protein